MRSRSGDDTADPHKENTLPITIQELASAGPSAIESLGPEPGGPTVWVEISGQAVEPFTFALRCGLFAAGGERA
jgi:hypothetical protein